MRIDCVLLPNTRKHNKSTRRSRDETWKKFPRHVGDLVSLEISADMVALLRVRQETHWLAGFQAGKFRVSTRKEDEYQRNFCLCLNRPLSFPFAVFLSSFAWNKEEIRLPVLHFNGGVRSYFAIQHKNIQIFADIF